MTAKNVVFMTIEMAQANLIIWPQLFEKERREVLSSRMLVCQGKLQREGAVIHIIAQHLVPLEDYLSGKTSGEGRYILKNFEAQTRDFH